MRNTLPAMTYVQTAFAALSGEVGVGVEGSNGTVAGDDKFHANSGSSLTTPPLEPHGAPRRYFDVFSRGVRACNWTAAASVPWLALSQTAGTVGGVEPDTRVYVSVADWAKAHSQTVQVNITTSCRADDKYGFKSPVVLVPVAMRSPPSSFSLGFVEADGTIAIEAAHYQAVVPPASAAKATNATATNTTYHTLHQYGRTGSAVGLWPQNTEKLAVADAPALEYRLYLFSNASGAPGGRANVTVLLSPTQNYLGDDTPLEYAIALYPDSVASSPPAPTFVRPVGRSIGTNMPAGWGDSVADSVWGVTGNMTTTSFPLASASAAYILRIWALMPSIMVQKVIVNLGGVRPSYFGPPESFLVGRDRLGAYNATTFADAPGTMGGFGSETKA